MWNKDPAYPAVTLSVALEKVARLLDSFETSEINVAQALECWNLKPRSRAGARLIDTLQSYGLIRPPEDSENARIRISRAALRDYFSAEASPEQRNRAVQRFALKPAIFQVIWERWAFDISDDGGLKSFLVDDLGYSPRTTAGLLRDYRETIELARRHGLRDWSKQDERGADGDQGDQIEYASPASAGGREPSDDTHTDFDIGEEVDIDLSRLPVRPEPVFVLDTGVAKAKPDDAGDLDSGSARESPGKSVYGVTVLQEVARFQVSSERRIYLMADGPVNRGDLESLLAQLTLKLGIGDIDESDPS